MATILVTGGAGFIGSHIVDRLVQDNHRVIVVDNLSLGKKEFVNKKAEFRQADISDYNKIEKYFNCVDAVFHLAADPRLQVSIEDPIKTHASNVTGTLNVLHAAVKNKVTKVVFTSSCAIYGDQPLPFAEDSVIKPMSPYGLHKYMGEQYCRLFNQLYGLETVCLRYFNVFGPRKLANGSYPMVIPTFLQQRLDNEKLTIIGDGESTRDYVHVSDVVEANIKAWQSNITDGRPINIGNGIQVSVNDIAKLIGGETANLPPRAGEMRYVQADISRAKKDLGWEPSKKFADGLNELKSEWGVS